MSHTDGRYEISKDGTTVRAPSMEEVLELARAFGLVPGGVDDPTDPVPADEPTELHGQRDRDNATRCLKALHVVKDAGADGIPAKDLAAQLGVSGQALSVVKLVLKRFETDMGVDRDSVVSSHYRPGEGSRWKAGHAIDRGIEVVERALARAAPGGAP